MGDEWMRWREPVPKEDWGDQTTELELGVRGLHGG